MSELLRWITSPEWAQAVRALLHTLWQGAIIALALAIVLRRAGSPVGRYRCSLVALAGLLLAGIVTWAILVNQVEEPRSGPVLSPLAHADQSPARTEVAMPAIKVTANTPDPKRAPPWTAWLALVWLTGAVLMVVRAGIQVAGAERLRRSSRPLADGRVAELLVETRRAMGLTRTIQIAVTEKLTSPAVVGVIVPTLIVPLSLLSTLTPEQWRFVLLHELAHIRRGDYFANLFQLLVEALLFFNPAAWWISHQVRREREACCDAMAIELSGAPADYARTLVRVAEDVLQSAPSAALAFGDQREPSSLTERVQRLLVPDYRPSLRLTWRAMLMALLTSGLLLFLSAAATRMTVEAILSPQQRIEKIEQKLVEYGLKPIVDGTALRKKVSVTAHVRTLDGSPLPKHSSVYIHSSSTTAHGQSSQSSAARVMPDGFATNSVNAGQIFLEMDVAGYAPLLRGPFDGTATNAIDAGELLLDRGFDVVLQVSDAESGAPVTDVPVHARFMLLETGQTLQRQHDVKSDAAGRVTLPLCIDHPLQVFVNTPGYEFLQHRFDQLRAGQPLELKLRRGALLPGKVLDKITGDAIPGATVRVIHEKGETEMHYQWTDATRVLAQTDENGRFSITQLRRSTKYWLGISAPGHESVIIETTPRDSGAMLVKLGPELIVRGRVIGDLSGLQKINDDRVLSRSFSEEFDQVSHSDSEWVPLRVANGVTTFQFTNHLAGLVTLSGKGYREERQVTAPVDGWIVDLTEEGGGDAKHLAENRPQREVVFRFTHPSGVTARGTVGVTIPDNLNKRHRTAHVQEMELTQGEVRVQIAIGGSTSIEPRHMIGYWFNRAGKSGSLLSIDVTNGVGPMVFEIPLVPAGAIYARARNADATPAGGLFFGVHELKRAPGRSNSSSLETGGDSISGMGPRKWASGPLPLGGVYQVYGWRGNSFVVSKPVTLTEVNPDAEVELQFPPGQTFEGLVLGPDGQPIRETRLQASFSLDESQGFQLKPVFTDDRGRFRLESATPDLGEYSVDVNAPSVRAEFVKLKFRSQPQTIRLQRGRTLAGRVVEAGTHHVLPDVEVRAQHFVDYNEDYKSKRPMVSTRTDTEGRFEFTSLGDGEYMLHLDCGQMDGWRKFRAVSTTNAILEVKLYEWSGVKPKASAKK